jgi:hypothetical protein
MKRTLSHLLFSQMGFTSRLHLRFTQMEETPLPAPADIIDVISTRLSFPRKTVAQHDRLLVINGYRKISGRGRSASATPDDAAALLVAVAATPIAGPAISIANFKSYANLKGANVLLGKVSTWKEVDALRDLADGHTLLEAIGKIIDCVSKNALLSNINGSPRIDDQYFDVQVSVELHAPSPRAAITIEHAPDGCHESDFVERLDYYPLGEPAQGIGSDFAQNRSFGMMTLWSLAALFRATGQRDK